MRRQPQITGLASAELSQVAKAVRSEGGVLLRGTFGGNVYAFTKGLFPLERFCDDIGKSRKAIRWRRDYQVWFVRMKSRAHKMRAYERRAAREEIR